MERAGPLNGETGRDHLAALLADVHHARHRLDGARNGARAADLQVLRQALLQTLEAYAGALADAGAPLPYRLRDEIGLLKGLGGRG
ncbi:hypothetical protein [Nocardioides okcheonensis]|uniref:hypothetical protein n=1 Tax=Nocardioides okcheonensis TaxID=2894081 RepID=UPI001E47F1EB|nr:hypothetical protein [Nocardioides okcheonensis]UFN44611.1 hypothetical protein LN652_21640 [Nocardioides okcheonensis]